MGYGCIEALMDSCACECICGPQNFEGIAICEDPKRPGASTEYVTADGRRLPNLGEKHAAGISEERSKMAINFQVTTVGKPFVAVSRLTAAGHEVWFGKDGGAVRNKANGKVTQLHKKNNVCVMCILVKHQAPQAPPKRVFNRQ